MCGICGLIYKNQARAVERSVVQNMNDVIAHRGPDSEGFYIDRHVGLAMRRLKIIDLYSGEQPISNERKTVWVVFNGEIYNYLQLRRELEAKGHMFYTTSDTETIVHLYEEFGVDCVDHLRGMFAFAVWDSEKDRLMLARDRLGKKPLYFADCKGVFLFGSEIKSILQYPHFPRQIDFEAIHHYLTLQYVPDPWTAFKWIQKLPPAHRLVYQNGQFEIERYWDLVYQPKLKVKGAAAQDIKEQLKDLIKESVQIRLMSEVPLGAHLSGGIDSSIVVGLMAGMMDQPLKTFSIGFQEDAFNELPYAREIAERFGTDHHEFIQEPDVLGLLPSLVRHFDEPFADPAAIPTWYLAKLTRQYVTVALNGDGGDEAFAGYQRYYADSLADAYRLIPNFLRVYMLDPLIRLFPVKTDKPLEKNYFMALRQLTRAAKLSHTASVIRWGSYFNEAEKWALYNDETKGQTKDIVTPQLLETLFYRVNASTRLDRTLYTDVNAYLPGALLPKVDRMTMAHSLEARSPFLDHQVMELAALLPTRWKIKGSSTKKILRELFSDLMPETVKNRGKLGFSVPLGLWFKTVQYQEVKDILLSPDAKLKDLFQISQVEKLIETNRAGKMDNGKRLWALLNLEFWLRLYQPT